MAGTFLPAIIDAVLPFPAYFIERVRNAAICARVQVAVGSNLPPPTPVVMPFSTAQATALA